MNSNLRKICMVVGLIVITAIASASIYINLKANTQEQKERQVAIVGIEKQQAQQAEVKKEKEKMEASPVVSSGANKIYTVVPLEDDTVVGTIQYKAGKPLAEPLSSGIGKVITSLSEIDIKRIQSYEPFSTVNGKIIEDYVSFEDMYATQRENCDGMIELFSPIAFQQYSGAKVGWITSPKLLYNDIVNRFCLRGILNLTYNNNENKFGLLPNQCYQSEVEYNIRYTSKNGNHYIRVEGISYLSKFKAVQ